MLSSGLIIAGAAGPRFAHAVRVESSFVFLLTISPRRTDRSASVQVMSTVMTLTVASAFLSSTWSCRPSCADLRT